MPDYTRAQFDPTQFQEAQNKAYSVLAAICGPEVAMAFARYYGKAISPDQIVNAARDFGLWTAQTGMRGPQAQKALMDKLGIPAQFSPEVNQNAIQQALAEGRIAALSTPGHYFTLQGYNPQTGQYDTGQSGQAYRGGGQFLTMAQMQQLGGAAQGQFISDPVQQQAAEIAAALDYNNKEQLGQYIRYAAAKRGIDPNVAFNVANSEGFNTYTGDYGSSFGPFQLHYGNVAAGGNAVSGLGDAFTKATGLDARDPRTVQAQIDYALDLARQNGWGAWHGAQGLGYSNYQGIGTFNGDPSQFGDYSNLSTPAAAIGNNSPAARQAGLPRQLVTGLPSFGQNPALMGRATTGLPNLTGYPTIQMGRQVMTPFGAVSGFNSPTISPPVVQARTWL